MPDRITTYKPPGYRSYDQTEAKRATNRFTASRQWRRLRLMVLNDNPLCVRCQEQGLVVPAVDVDHVIDRHERPDLAYDLDNLQGLCKRCHTLKTRGRL